MKSTDKKHSTLNNMLYLYGNMGREHPSYVIAIFVRAIADMALPILTSAVVATILLIVSEENGWERNRWLFGGVLVLTFVALSCSQVLRVHAMYAGNSYRVSKIQEILKKLMNIPYYKFEDRETHELLGKAQQLSHSPEGAFQKGFTVLYNFTKNSIGIILYGALVTNIHPVLVVVIVVFSFLQYRFSLKTNRIEKEIKDTLAPLKKKTDYLVRSTGDFKAAKEMRLFHMESWFEEEFSDRYRDQFDQTAVLSKRKFKGALLASLFAIVRDGIAYYFLISQISQGLLSAPLFSFYFGIIASISLWITGLMTDLVDVRLMSLELNDYRAYQEVGDDTIRGSASVDSLELPVSIAFHDVSFRYEGAESDTISHLNLLVKPGEKLGVIGMNGAGKTTLIKMLCGLYEPTEGTITINGIPSTDFKREEYYELFSPVFQDYFELPSTIKETIQQGKNARSKDYREVLELSGLQQELKKFAAGDETKLVKAVHQDAVDLSGGQKQKLQMARAIYKNAPVVILDEPTAALDPIAESEVYQRYNAITEDKTSLFISHRLSSTIFCDRLIFMENGSIVEQGTHEELLAQNGKYAEMYRIQSQYYQEQWEEEHAI